MRKLSLALVIALASCGGSTLAFAQQARQMTRTTTATTLGDSTIWGVSDTLTSKTTFVTKAVSVAAFRKALSKGAAFDSIRTTVLNLTSGAVSGAPTWSGKPRFNAAWTSTGRDSLLAGSALAFAATDTVYGTPTWNAIQTFATGQVVDSATGAARSQILTTARALWGNNFDGSAAITGNLSSVGNITATAGFSLTTTGASRTVTLQSTNGSSTALNTLVLGADTSVTAIGRFVGPVATATLPTFSFTGATGDGIYKVAGGDTVAFAINGVRGLSVLGGATAKLLGGAGNFTLISGSGASRQATFQTTTSGSTATTFMRANELQQSLFADGAAATPGIGFASDSLLGLYRLGTAGASDTLAISANGVQQMKIAAAGILRLPILPAEGSTKNAMCWDGTTFNVTQNAAATCTVSSSRFKHDIVPLTDSVAQHVVFGLHPVTFRYNEGNGPAIGVIAENADSVDSRLATRDAQGRINSINYEQITASLLSVVRDQRDRIDSLAARLLRAEIRIDSISADAHKFDSCTGYACIVVPKLDCANARTTALSNGVTLTDCPLLYTKP